MVRASPIPLWFTDEADTQSYSPLIPRPNFAINYNNSYLGTKFRAVCITSNTSPPDVMPAEEPSSTLFISLLTACQNPFIAHIVVETPAALNFFVFPGGQIGTKNTQAEALIRQYSLLLLTSLLIALAFAHRESDQLSGQVAGAMAVYHVGPLVRAGMKVIRGGLSAWGPWLLVFAAHTFCLIRLVEECLKHYG